MAKRKAAAAAARKKGATRRAGPPKAARKRAAKGSKKAARKVARKGKAAGKARGTARKASGRKAAGRKAAGATARKGARKVAASKTVTRKAGARKTGASKSAGRKAAARKTAPRPSAARGAHTSPRTLPVRKAPDLNRDRRTVGDEDDLVQSTPPSSLDLDRSASAVRTGRRTLRDRFADHTETSPAMTGGDVDADWESAYSVGDEAPGGDNPTPDQDIVDDIGRAVGVEYQDNEELKGADKVTERDKHRWELDPASSDDWDER